MADFTSTRRSLLGAMALAPAAISVPVLAFPAANANLIAELEALDQTTRALEADPRSSAAAWEAWERRSDALYRRVEALPATRENVAVKVRAVKSIYHDATPFAEDEPASTAEALAQQIVRSLIERSAA